MLASRLGLLLVIAAPLVTACVQRSDGSARSGMNPADIVVTADPVTAPVAPGKSVTFVIKVANAGPGDADDVRIVNTVGTQSALLSMTCAASAGAQCPDKLAGTIVVPNLKHDTSLTFNVSLKLAGLSTGTIIDSLVATYDKDADPNNNSVAVDAMVR